MYKPLGAYGDKAVVNKRYFEPTVEEIIARNPELVIALYTPQQSQLPTPQSVIQELHSRKELADVKAIRDNAIIPFLYYYSDPGPLAVDGIEQLAKQIAGRNRDAAPQ